MTCRFYVGLASVIVTAAFLCGLLEAYEVPLTAASVHEAYVLGRRNDQATAEFLSPYMKQLTAGTAHPDITQIELLTPLAEVVDWSRRNATSDYAEQQALKDYQSYGDKVVVQITLVLPAAYAQARQNAAEGNPQPQDKNAPLRPENFWQNFRFSLKQHDKIIPSRAIHNKPIYSSPTKDTPSVLDGATVWLEYDARDIASDAVTVEVVTPEPKTISAVFDLKRLR